jgi:hypothetical protein
VSKAQPDGTVPEARRSWQDAGHLASANEIAGASRSAMQLIAIPSTLAILKTRHFSVHVDIKVIRTLMDERHVFWQLSQAQLRR